MMDIETIKSEAPRDFLVKIKLAMNLVNDVSQRLFGHEVPEADKIAIWNEEYEKYKIKRGIK